MDLHASLWLFQHGFTIMEKANPLLRQVAICQVLMVLSCLSAVTAGEESVELADRSRDAFQRMSKRTTLADTLHQAGRRRASASQAGRVATWSAGGSW